MQDIFETSKQQLVDISSELKLNTQLLNKLLQPNFVHEHELEIEMDDGSTESFTAYRSQHSNAVGPYKGGIRFDSEVSEGEVKALSMWMSWKTALLNLPFGGGKGGVIVNPKELSQQELQRLSRAYVKAFYEVIGPDKDIPAPDVNTNSQIMAWMVDEYETLAGGYAPGTFTGKPVEIGGSLGRTEATGRGGAVVLDRFMTKTGLGKDAKIALQGFGNVGQYFALKMYRDGYKVVAISDSSATIYHQDGLDIEKLIKHKITSGSLAGYTDSAKISELPSDEILSLSVDILAPAARDGVITTENVADIHAKYILELANGPITHDAEQLLLDRAVVIIPDILANAGGVTVSSFEWSQNRSGYYWTLEEVNSRLDRMMKEALDRVLEVSDERDLDLRKAAYLLAVKRVADALVLRGY